MLAETFAAFRRFAPSLALILICAASAEAWGASPPASPAKPDPVPAAQSAFYGVGVAAEGVVFRVYSSGCSNKEHFDAPVVDRSGNLPTISLKRLQRDPCRALLVEGVELTYAWEELGLSANESFRVSNLFSHDQTTAPSDEKARSPIASSGAGVAETIWGVNLTGGWISFFVSAPEGSEGRDMRDLYTLDAAPGSGARGAALKLTLRRAPGTGQPSGAPAEVSFSLAELGLKRSDTLEIANAFAAGSASAPDADPDADLNPDAIGGKSAPANPGHASASFAPIREVKRIGLSVTSMAPMKLLIKADGTVSGGGWSNAQLHPRMTFAPPSDGIYEFDFVASPPAPGDMVIQAILPVEASYEMQSVSPDFKGVRVYGETNALSQWIDLPQ
jgi:hypothetical protein